VIEVIEEIEEVIEVTTEQDPTPADFTSVSTVCSRLPLSLIMAWLLVGKVSRYVREQELRDLFSRYGRIRDLVLRVRI